MTRWKWHRLRSDLITEWWAPGIGRFRPIKFPIIRWWRLAHWFSNGKYYDHSLEGGWCPMCGAWYLYESDEGGPGWVEQHGNGNGKSKRFELR
jgi:hypothetical protein